MSHGPYLVGSFGQQFVLLTNRVATLAAAFCNLTMGCTDPVHAADRTKIDAFVKQGRIDLGRGLIGESGCAKMGKNLIPFTFRQGTH